MLLVAKINGHGAKKNLPFATVNDPVEKNNGGLIRNYFSYYTIVLYKMT